MPVDIRRSLLLLPVFSFVLAISLPAKANSIPLTVTGEGVAGSGLDSVSVNAGFFSAFSAAPDGPRDIGIGIIGVPSSFSWSSVPFSGFGFTAVSVGKAFTDILNGGIDFAGTFTVPASALISGTFVAPVDVLGELQAFQDLTLGQGFFTQGPLMADLLFGGTGTGTFQIVDIGDGQYDIELVTVDFKTGGTLTAAVPEPASLILFGTGLAGLALALKHRRSFIQRVH